MTLSAMALSVAIARLAMAETSGAYRPVVSEFIFAEAPFASCHASTVVETPAGLVAAWFGGSAEGNSDVGIWLSRQLGGEWSAPVEVANGIQSDAQRYACWNPVLYQIPNGDLMLFYKCGPSPSSWWGMLMTSSDHGQSWSAPHELPPAILGPIKNKPILVGDRTLICGSSSESSNGAWCVNLEVSRDWGESWRRSKPIDDRNDFHAIQPSILAHADGRLQLLCRSKERSILTSWSRDGGTTWSELQRTELPNPNSGIDAVTLRDGRHLLVYNHTPGQPGAPAGRSFLNVAVSNDGVHWKAACVLENDRGKEFSYPAVIQTNDQLVHVTYTWKRERIKHVAIDPSSLDLRPMKGGAWPQLASDDHS